MSPLVLLLYGTVVTLLVTASVAVLVGDAVAEWRTGRREGARVSRARPVSATRE